MPASSVRALFLSFDLSLSRSLVWVFQRLLNDELLLAIYSGKLAQGVSQGMEES